MPRWWKKGEDEALRREIEETRMGSYVENEAGPECSCGGPTVVKKLPDGSAVLLCFFHTPEGGLVSTLPKARPQGWPGPADDSRLLFMDDAGLHELQRPDTGTFDDLPGAPSEGEI